MGRIKYIFFIIVFLIIFGNYIFAKEYLKDEYKFENKENGETNVVINGKQPLDYTLDEASKMTKSGNPLDLVVAYKDYVESIGETISQDEFNHDFRIGDFEEDEEYPKIYDDLYKASFKIEDNLKENLVPENNNIEYVSQKDKSNNVVKIIIICIVLIIIVVCYIIKRIKALLLLGLGILAYGIFSIFVAKQVEDKYNHISNYIINGTKDNHIVNNIDKMNDEKFRKEYIENISREWNVAGFINGYMMNINYILKLKNSKESFFSINEYFEDKKWDDRFIDDQEYEKYRKELDNWSFTNMEKDLYVRNVPILKYDNSKLDERINIITQNSIEYYEDKKIFNNIDISDIDSENESTFFENLIKRINIEGINYKNWQEEYKSYEELYIYFRNIYGSFGVTSYRNDFDNSVISYFKDWYIDGESRDIELPYGVTLEYRAPEFIKKDIKEIVYTNERELDHDSKEKQVYVMYYKDSEGKLGASYTDVEFTKTGRNYEISFNPVDLMYDIKKPTAKLVVK